MIWRAGLQFGLFAFGLGVILVGEFSVGGGLLGPTPSGWIEAFGKPAAQLGLASQLVAGAMPLPRARLMPPS